ncbi:lipase family protein [Chitinophaga arvensicola]|uniref:Lipase (Class 3) n=1 Tax=Chitinophaga arvensicola TaxID=29529 RepID=A0A1I0QDJ9_9BACT|nr:hypothetical protein [Chitinophaga arvensicola]SEW24680.1 Lipase (class 3) [Chitinophaga arvensicola]
MEPQVKSAAISISEAISICGCVAIAVGINKKASKNGVDPDPNPSLDAYKDICADPTYALLLNPAFLKRFRILYNIQMPEKSNFVNVWSYFGFIAQNKMTKDYVIAIRGTQNLFETFADEDIIPTLFREYNNEARVPQGFYKLFEAGRIVSLPEDTDPITPVSLSKLATDPGKYMNGAGHQRITVTGHSLGAAVATFFAAAATVKLGTKFNLSLCTFASPKTGNEAFTSLASSTIAECLRIYNAEDTVPDLPVWKEANSNLYTHVTGGFKIDSTGDPNVNHEGAGCAHQLPVYLYLLEKLDGNDNPDIISSGDDARCRVS